MPAEILSCQKDGLLNLFRNILKQSEFLMRNCLEACWKLTVKPFFMSHIFDSLSYWRNANMWLFGCEILEGYTQDISNISKSSRQQSGCIQFVTQNCRPFLTSANADNIYNFGEHLICTVQNFADVWKQSASTLSTINTTKHWQDAVFRTFSAPTFAVTVKVTQQCIQLTSHHHGNSMSIISITSSKWNRSLTVD